jgi:Mor family transcriptional regulator
MKNTKVPEEQVSKIVESFQDGKEIGPISREFGLSRAGVRKILQREEVYETRKNTQYKLTEEQKVLAIRSYLDGKDISDLASEYSFSGRGMLSLLQREEVYKGRKRTRKVTEEQTEEIVSAYQEGERVASLARRFPLSETGISDLLKREGAYKTGRDNRRYQVDESLFERIDTPDKAYWLGFISADGHVGDYVVRIRLGIKDRAHLERFRSFMQSDHPIVDTYGQCGTPVSEIYISSRRLSKSFRCLGLSSNKTFSITPCEQVPDNLLRHYWRGAVDGDGWVLERKRASGKSGWVI